ncbi:MAG: flavodoxin domain-containing protein, partial [Thermoleophilia bacterium]
MARILITYYSVSGNTKKMAEAVAEGARDAGGQVDLVTINEASERMSDLPGYGAIVIGSPTYYGSAAPQVLDLFRRINGLKHNSALVGKVGAAFATSGHPTGGGCTCIMSIIQALLIMGLIVVGDPPV